MTILWERGVASVADIVTALKGQHNVSYSTVQTLLRILEAKGYVSHEKSGRAFFYRAVVDQKQAQRRALSHLVARLFNNSPSLLVLNVLEDERIGPAELERLRKLFDEAK